LDAARGEPPEAFRARAKAAAEAERTPFIVFGGDHGSGGMMRRYRLVKATVEVYLSQIDIWPDDRAVSPSL
jgi:hypothetical protein